jgi:O-antigen/teichoic acid export membrane protein
MTLSPAAGGAPRISRSLVFSGLTAGSAALLFLLQALAGHVLSVDDFGKFGFALRLATIGEALMDFGIHQVTVRAIARDRSQASRLLHNSLALKAVPAAVMFLVMSGVVFWLRPEPEVRAVSLLLLGSAILRSYILTTRGILLGLERFGRDCLVVVTDRLLLLVTGGLALLLGHGLIGLAMAFVAARLLAVTGALTIVRSVVGSLSVEFDRAVWRDLQRRALPLGSFLIALNLYSYIDTVMLGRLSTWSDTALYTAAFTIYEGLSYAPAVLSSVLTPRLSHLWSADPGQHRRLTLLGLLAAVVLAVVLAVPLWAVARPLLAIVFNGHGATDYGDAATALHILLAGLGFIFVSWILQATAISVFRERVLLVTTATGAVFNILLNLMLIPAYGRNGAALATLASEGLTMLLLAYGLRDVLSGSAAETVRR